MDHEHILGCNGSADDTESDTNLQEVIFISVTSTMAILLVSSVILNILTVISVKKFKRLQIPANYILVNLSISDCAAASASSVYLISDTLLEGERAICVVSIGLVFVTFSASLLGLALVAFDRFSALVKPLTYSSRLTYQRIILYVALIWTYATVVTVISLCIMLFGEDILDVMTGNSVVLSTFDSNRSFPLATHSDLLCISGTGANIALMCQMLFVFSPGALVMFYCYGRVMIVARHHSRAISAVHDNLSQSKFNKTYGMFRGKKYFVTLSSILGEFVLTWAAAVTLTLLDIFCTDCFRNDLIPHSYICILAVVTIGLNPWIYACRSQDFKAAYLRLYKTARQCCKREPAPSNRPRRDSRFSDGLSRTNSLVGNMQHLQALYNDAYYKQKSQNNNGASCCTPVVELPSLSPTAQAVLPKAEPSPSLTVHAVQPMAEPIQSLTPD